MKKHTDFQNMFKGIVTDLEKTIKEHLKRINNNDKMNIEGVLFSENGISNPIHKESDIESNAHIIYGIEIGDLEQLIFNVECMNTDYNLLIDEISVENLIYIVGELETID